ncbi:MAG: hypothetical protein RR342_01095 [Bacilli bacterium]
MAKKYATLYEIRYLLNVWDVLDLYEIMIVNESNNNIAREQYMKN